MVLGSERGFEMTVGTDILTTDRAVFLTALGTDFAASLAQDVQMVVAYRIIPSRGKTSLTAQRINLF